MFKIGNWDAICDVCGQEYKAYELKERWDGLMVCSHDFETRHPQDLLRTFSDDSSVPWTRPPPEDIFKDGPGCTAFSINGAAGWGTAGCARAGVNTGTGDFGSYTLWIYADQNDAIATVALAGVAISGDFGKSLRPER